MNMSFSALSAVSICLGICFSVNNVNAASYFETYATPKTKATNSNQGKSAGQRVLANKERHSLQSETLFQDYTDLKNKLSQNYGLNFGADISFMGQRGAPNGSKTSFQTEIYSYLTWQTFKNQYGIGTLNAAYTITRYGGSINGNNLSNRIGVATGINDSGDSSESFDELYYSYQLGSQWNWLTLAAGQFPLYSFDGSTYNSNQQINFINYALSQNASSTYSTAGVGAYLQVNPSENWSFTFGSQDASDINGRSIRINSLHDKHFTTFASLSYSPNINNLGTGQYSVLLYNQPAVDEQPETTNGWSLNLSQNIGEKWNIFARINGVTGHTAEISQSYVLGAVYNNPLDRNPLDQIGFAAAYNKIDAEAVGEPLQHSAETILETYWAWGISKWMTITPDIQFYIHPAENLKSNYDTVFSLRATLLF